MLNMFYGESKFLEREFFSKIASARDKGGTFFFPYNHGYWNKISPFYNRKNFVDRYLFLGPTNSLSGRIKIESGGFTDNFKLISSLKV